MWPGLLGRRGKIPFVCCRGGCWRSRRRTTQPATPIPSTISTTPTVSHSGLRATVISAPVKAHTIALCSSQASSCSASGCRSELGMAPPAVRATPCRCGAGRPTGCPELPASRGAPPRTEQPVAMLRSPGEAASQQAYQATTPRRTRPPHLGVAASPRACRCGRSSRVTPGKPVTFAQASSTQRPPVGVDAVRWGGTTVVWRVW